jgi:cyclin-dependent kinase 9
MKMELPLGQKRKVKERLKPYVKDPYACDLLDKLLTLDPTKRIDSDSALNHDFFWTDPLPCDLSKMLAQHTHSMFEYLATRRSGHMRPHPQQLPQAKPSSTLDSGYQDRVF